MARVCTLVLEEHGTAPGSACPRRHLVARSPNRSVGGDPCENWAKSALMGDVRPGPRALLGQWRSGARFPRRDNGQHAEVGKHPAPSGALRQSFRILLDVYFSSREAPSTIRCIETRRAPCGHGSFRIGKHPAPSGALGRWLLLSSLVFSFRSMGLAHNKAIGHHTPLHRPTSSNATAAPSTSALPAHDAHTG